jgi:hypothetical protein
VSLVIEFTLLVVILTFFGSGSRSSNPNNNNDKPVKKRKLNRNTSTQIVTNNNNIHNGSFQRHDLDKEIDQFLPFVKDILEGSEVLNKKTNVFNY